MTASHVSALENRREHMLTTDRRLLHMATRPRYGWIDLRGDLFGGLTTAVVALPVALALGVAVGVASGGDAGSGALAGLYGAIAVGFFAAVFGGTRGQISGPTAPMAVAMTVVVLQHSLAEAFAVVLLAGLIQIGLGVLRLGRFISYTPYSVISGFMSGIGVIIIALQVLPFFGAEIQSGKLPDLIAAWPEAIAEINAEAFGIAIVTLLVAVGWPRRLRNVCPPTLAALILGTVLGVVALGGAPTIGEVPSGLPTIDLAQLLRWVPAQRAPVCVHPRPARLDRQPAHLVDRRLTHAQEPQPKS